MNVAFDGNADSRRTWISRSLAMRRRNFFLAKRMLYGIGGAVMRSSVCPLNMGMTSSGPAL